MFVIDLEFNSYTKRKFLNQSLHMQLFVKKSLYIVNRSYNFVNLIWLIEYDLTIMWQILDENTY